MKSVIIEAATIAKAVEEAWKKAGSPVEFFTKIVELPKSGFLGFGAKNAVIALFFKKESDVKEAVQNQKPEVLSQESYIGFFNNKDLKAENPNKKPDNKKVDKEIDKKDPIAQNDQRNQQNSDQRRFKKPQHQNQKNPNQNQKKNDVQLVAPHQNNKQQEKKPVQPLLRPLNPVQVKPNQSVDQKNILIQKTENPQRSNNQRRANNPARPQGQNNRPRPQNNKNQDKNVAETAPSATLKSDN